MATLIRNGVAQHFDTLRYFHTKQAFKAFSLTIAFLLPQVLTVRVWKSCSSPCLCF